MNYTLIFCRNSSRTNGNTPKTISAPLLSTNIATFLYGGSFILAIHLSRLSINQGLPENF